MHVLYQVYNCVLVVIKVCFVDSAHIISLFTDAVVWCSKWLCIMDKWLVLPPVGAAACVVQYIWPISTSPSIYSIIYTLLIFCNISCSMHTHCTFRHAGSAWWWNIWHSKVSRVGHCSAVRSPYCYRFIGGRCYTMHAWLHDHLQSSVGICCPHVHAGL